MTHCLFENVYFSVYIVYVIHLFIHSYFIFSKYFILVRVMVDPGPITGTLGVRWEYPLVHKKASFTHSHLGAV